MAKPLTTPPPSSSIARLIDASAVTRALDPAATPRPALPSSGGAEGPPSRQRRRSVKREIVLSNDAAQVLDDLLDRLRRATGTRLSCSHAVRAVLLTFAPCLAAIESRVTTAEPWRLPANGSRHDGDRAAFERRMAAAITAALLDCQSPRD